MSNQPPRIGTWLLRMICSDEHFDEISGDLEEIYQDNVERRGKFIAGFLYVKDALLTVRNIGFFSLNRAMLANLVTIAWRSLKKRTSYSVLNILGLAASIAASFLLWMYVRDQTSYDKDFAHANRIYRVNLEADMNGKVDVYSNVPQPLAAALKSSYTQIDEVARVALTNHIGTLEFDEKKVRSMNFVIADPAIIRIYDKEFIQGDPKTALLEPASIVINRQMAEDLFGGIDVLGRVVRFIEFEQDLTITGVVENDLRRSHFPMDIIVPWDTFKQFDSQEWYGFHTYAYVLLNPANDIATLQEQMPLFFDRYLKKTFDDFGGKGRVFFQPITDIHLADELVWEPNGHGSETNVLALTFVAVLLIVFAVINYVNLSTAQAVERAGEVSIRKVMGSSRQMLWAQFLSESILLAMTSGIIALILAWILLPFFNQLTGINLNSYEFFTWINVWNILFLSLGIGMLAGMFPAFYLSASPAVNSLKGKFTTSSAGEILRRILVSTQYFIAALLISGILLVYNQVTFIKNKDVGFQRQNLINIHIPSDTTVNEHLNVYLDAIRASAYVESAALAQVDLHLESNSFTPVLENEDGSQFQMGSDIMRVSSEFFPTIGADIVAGRNFERARPTDGESFIMINEAAARKFGWEENPLGGKFVGWTPFEKADPKMSVVGVVKDFHLGVSYQFVHPIIIFFHDNATSNLYVRIKGDDIKGALAMLESTWSGFYPDSKIEYSFVDQDLNALYNREENFLSLLSCLCIVIVFIASLGIVGLISYTTQLKRREIAIRKVLGSPIRHIITILTRKFLLLLIVANVLAIPATWYVVGLWLSNFPDRINTGIEAFLAPFAVCVLFTALSIAFHTSRAALANPVEALKCE